jgi:hypothetical protein
MRRATLISGSYNRVGAPGRGAGREVKLQVRLVEVKAKSRYPTQTYIDAGLLVGASRAMDNPAVLPVRNERELP